ncbi:hypothetical protein ACFY7C_36395 [Streptomyces sp. NPDC012769]|uniref:hypothetical protein n=1 Tax=Streptomyces sp. NPDC012769 TaxID=3364848 RepID=UPI00367CCFD7
METIHPDSDSSLFHEMLIGPPETWPLRADGGPRRVELSNNYCDTGCCGGVFVTIERCGGLVAWAWENTDDIRVPLPPDSHFDADQYDAELDRFVADHSWEEPVDTAARLLARELVALDWYRRWNCLPPSWGRRLGRRPWREGPPHDAVPRRGFAPRDGLSLLHHGRHRERTRRGPGPAIRRTYQHLRPAFGRATRLIRSWLAEPGSPAPDLLRWAFSRLT